MNALSDVDRRVVERHNTDAPLTADFVASFPDGTRDDSSFDAVETALDLAGVDCGGMGEPWLKVTERVALLAAERDQFRTALVAMRAERDALAVAVKTARADALEEAARVVERMPRWVSVPGQYQGDVDQSYPVSRPISLPDAAAAIRALPGSPV